MTKIRLKDPLPSFPDVALSDKLGLRAKGLYAVVRSLAQDSATVLTLDQVTGHTGLEPGAVSGLLRELADASLVVTR